jgi:gliding motility-associated lipoprotein GldH
MNSPSLKTIFTGIIPSSGRIIVPAFIISLLLFSCKSGTLYDDNKSLPGNVWNAEKILRFEVGLQDTTSICKFYLNVRHTTNYRYSNLFLFINTTFPDGKEARDTVECILADPSGKWLGKGISNVRDNQILLRRGIRFPMQGTYIFELEQSMRESELQGIMDVGLRIAKE